MTFLSIVRTKGQGPLEDWHGVSEPLEPDETGGVGMEGIELGVEQLASLVEMRDGRRAVPLPVFQHRQHGVTRRIAGTKLE